MSDSNIFLVLAFDHPTRAVESVADRMAAGLCTLGFDAAAVSLPRDAAKLAALPPGQVCGVLSMGPLPLSVRIGAPSRIRRTGMAATPESASPPTMRRSVVAWPKGITSIGKE